MIKKFNLAILITPLLLFSIGFITLLSTSVSLIKDHVVFFIIGLVFYFVFAFIDYSIYAHLHKYIYWFAIVFLLLTYLFAEFRFGSARWIELGPLNFQTSEFAKLALIIAVATVITRGKDSINSLKRLLTLLVILSPIVFLIFLQPDLGTAAVVIGVFLGLVFLGGIKAIYILITFLVMGILSAPIWNLLKTYQKDRILVFLNPQLDVLGSGYNVIQSLIAVGSGGLLGKGFGRGTQANLQFLPAYWTDFIFASFAEEWGFVGVFLLVSIYAVLLFSILYVAYRARDQFAQLLAIGIFFIFFFQFLINIGMNMGIMPVTGVTLPLISYGGSSMLFSLISLGIVQNIWMKR